MSKKIENYSLMFLVGLSVFAWLMPNHYLPWTTFHSDFIMSVAYGIPCLVFFFSHKLVRVKIESIHFLAIFFGSACLASLLVGWVPYRMQTVVPAVYIVGFFLAVCFGQIIAENYKSAIGTLVFVPPLIAAIISVGIQLAQWLHTPGYGITDIWISGSNGIRPAANMNQPNQLGTLLLWGMAAIVWLGQRGSLGTRTTCLALVYLGFGVGLTLSRTAVLSFILICLVFAAISFKQIKVRYILLFLLVALSIGAAWNFHSLVPWWLGISELDASGVEGLNRDNGIRLIIWKMFVDAGMSKIFFGFGPMMNLQAQFSQVANYQNLGNVLYSNAHNLFLEFWIWFGLPFALMAMLVFSRWFLSLRWIFKLNFGENHLLLCMLTVVLIHANLELPLHHAYFLLPTGFLMGVLISEGRQFLGPGVVFITGKNLCLLASIALSTAFFIAYEYMQIERQVTIYRFKSANILNTPDSHVPAVIVLDQLADQLWFNAIDPKKVLSDSDFVRAENYFNVRADCDVAVKFHSLATAKGTQGIDQALLKKIEAECY